MDTKNKSRNWKLWKAFLRLPDVSPHEKLLFQLLSSHGKKAFPGHARLAKFMGLKSTSSVKIHLNRLREKGWIDWKKRGFSDTNLYSINWSKFELIAIDENDLSISSNSASLSDYDMPTKIHSKIENKKIKEYPQRRFVFFFLKKTFPTLSDSQTNKLITEFYNIDILVSVFNLLLKVKAESIRHPYSYLKTHFSEGFYQLNEYDYYNVSGSFYMVYIDKDYRHLIKKPKSELAKLALQDELDETTHIVCDGCGILGVTPAMLYFSICFRKDKILCSRCSHPERDLVDDRKNVVDSQTIE